MDLCITMSAPRGNATCNAPALRNAGALPNDYIIFCTFLSYQQIDLSVDIVSVYAEVYNIAVDRPLTVKVL